VSPDPTPSHAPSPAGHPLATAPRSPDVRVVVRAYPKIVFFWVTWVASLVCGIITAVSSHPPSHLGTVWMCIFAFNLMVIAFDFSEVISIVVILFVALVIVAGLYFDFLRFIGDFFRNLDVGMNPGFYFTVFGVFSLFYVAVFLKTRFDYWEFRFNEVIHRRGMFADIKRYSTEDLRWFKEIPDVLERILAGSGRMILTTPRESHPIVIEHVLGIDRIDDKVADILGTKKVTL
jgi:hypothetical protein